MPYEFGDVVLVPFPFTNQSASKKRPAVIVSTGSYNRDKPDVVVMAITSQFRPSPALGEVWVGDWQAAKLLDCRPQYQREHQQHERIESKPDDRNHAD